MSTTQSLDTTQFGIDQNSEFVGEKDVDVINHADADEIQRRLEAYGEDEDNNITIKDAEQKAKAAFEVIARSDAVLVETQAWFVSKKMSDDTFDRWEPFFLAFPETTNNGQMLFRNMAALSEVAYTISQRDQYEQMARDGDEVENSDYSAIEQAQMAEQRAFTRYRLDSYHPKEWVDGSIIESVHVADVENQRDLLVSADGDGNLSCERGDIEQADIGIELDRYVDDGEFKVAVLTEAEDEITEAMKALDFDADNNEDDEYSSHRKYKRTVGRWEVDLRSIPEVVEDLATAAGVDTVGVHRVTEKAVRVHVSNEFGQDIAGYPNPDQ